MTRFFYEGKPLQWWAKELGTTYGAVYRRYSRKHTVYKDGRYDEYTGLEETILNHLGRFEVSSSVLYSRVIDDYGSVHKRAFQRYLSKLVGRGLVIRRPVGRGIHSGCLYALQKQSGRPR